MTEQTPTALEVTMSADDMRLVISALRHYANQTIGAERSSSNRVASELLRALQEEDIAA